ncbi:hypothetical protein BVX95_01540 [archaeon D22]|nr:hypothetical protein BVX95_01540 [archaeon D22]
MKRVTLIIILLLCLTSAAFASCPGDRDCDDIKDNDDKYPDDFDNDGIPDDYEEKYGLDVMKSNFGIDTDRDGLSDIKEYSLSKEGFMSSPALKDTDSDGLSDKEEYEMGSDPNSSFSPFNVKKPIFIIPIIVIIILFLSILYNILKNKDGLDKKEDKANDKKNKSDSKGILSQLSDIKDLILGPSVKKALEDKKKEQDEELELVKKKDENKAEEEKVQVNSNYIPTRNISSRDSLITALKSNKMKNQVKTTLSGFDEENQNENLTLFKEKESNKKVMEYLKMKKQGKN